MEKPKVGIVILNWNGFNDSRRCVESFRGLRYPNHELVIADNGSTDGSCEALRQEFPGLTLVETGRNLGYTGGNNVGIKRALADGSGYVLIVNNDTESINPDFVGELVREMESQPGLGVIGPKVLNPGNVVQHTILLAPTLSNSIRESVLYKTGRKEPEDYDRAQAVNAVSGVCWMIRREVFEKVGLLDEDYLSYVEEQDYCYRAQKAGWKIMYYPVESVVHYKEADDKNKERGYRQYVYARRNLVLFLRKHSGLRKAFFLAVLFLSSNSLKVVYSSLKRGRNDFYSRRLLLDLVSQFKTVLAKEGTCGRKT
ncbi:MAG: glycosyltransferase family 2 protein [Candidatus Eisenbacteria bacterium]|nr:glycosyltransferase family 2 protein [Candidatus Eisenbacteria bacterium]